MDKIKQTNTKEVTACSQEVNSEIKVAGSSMVMDQQSNAVTEASQHQQ